MNRLFDHEKLEVYRAALAFIEWLEPLLRVAIQLRPRLNSPIRARMFSSSYEFPFLPASEPLLTSHAHPRPKAIS
jgi:hypothetical protein